LATLRPAASSTRVSTVASTAAAVSFLTVTRAVTSAPAPAALVMTCVPHCSTCTASVTVSHTLRYSPAPGYQRELRSSGASRTASTFLPATFSAGVRSSAKLA